MNKSKILTMLFLSLFCAATWASPALKGISRKITLNDGTTLTVYQCGDEHLCYWQAANGRMFMDRNGKGELSEITSADLAIRKAMVSSKISQNIQRRKAAKHLAPQKRKADFLGKKKGLIILVEFQNQKFVTPDAGNFFQRVANERNFTEGNYRGSVKDYFIDQSYGKFELDFDVLGPVTVSHDYAYYGAPTKNDVDTCPWEMIVEACDLVNDKVNFADYDWDGDGTVEQVFVLYAGKGQSTCNDPSTIWPHEYELSSIRKNGIHIYGKGIERDGVTIDTYACANEVRGSGELDGIGTICHEFSHCMGLPDTYDTYYNGHFGMGDWDVMANGVYNGNGFTPAAYTSYNRMVCGWKEPIELCAEDVTIENMLPLAADGDFYIIRNDGSPDEYYLLENRQKTGWDKGLPAEGMLVLHVDYDADIWEKNIVNTIVDAKSDTPAESFYNTHQRLTIVHADNEDDWRFWKASWNAYSQTTIETDVFPYNGNDSLTNNSAPRAEVYNRNSDGSPYLNHGVHHIHQNADGTMGFEFKTISVKIADPDTPISDTELEGAIFYESFDLCLGTGGNDGVFKGTSEVASADFLADNGGWDSMEKNGGDRCAKFGNGARVGVVTSPVIDLDGREMLLEFNAAPWSKDDPSLELSVSGNATLSETMLEMKEGEWTRYSVKLKGEGRVRITFEPGKRFFLDEVVVRDASASGIYTMQNAEFRMQNQRSAANYYNLAGQRVSPNTKGLLIHNGKKIIIK